MGPGQGTPNSGSEEGHCGERFSLNEVVFDSEAGTSSRGKTDKDRDRNNIFSETELWGTRWPFYTRNMSSI